MRSVLKNKVLVSVIAILLIANIAMLFFFITGMKKPERVDRPDPRANHTTESFLQNRIGFSDQQMAEFNKLKQEHHQKLFPLFEDLRKQKDDYYLLVKEAPSDAQLDSLAARIGEKQRLLDREVFKTVREVRQICTSQQQASFDSMLPKIAYKMAGHIRKGDLKEEGLKRPN